jgi:hypothetical protein
MKEGEKKQMPEKQDLKSVVMFADISGFTNLTETLSKRGPEGAEIIAFAINRYFNHNSSEYLKSYKYSMKIFSLFIIDNLTSFKIICFLIVFILQYENIKTICCKIIFYF